MKKIQDVFDQLNAIKKQQKEIRTIYKDALANNQRYQNITEKLEQLRAEKKQIEEDTKSEMGSQCAKLEKLKEEIKDQNEMISDLAINQLVKGELIEIQDEYNYIYEPIFSVKFKKTGARIKL